MQFRLTFEEIQQLIQRRAGRSVPIIYGGPHTVRVAYDVNVLFKQASVGIDITVDRINGSDIFLSYSGGAAIEFMLRSALGHIKNQPGANIIEMLDGNRLLLSLGKNPQVAQVFNAVEINDIHFDEQYAMIDFTPKNL
ncbi:MAG: hypothetical protein K5650_02160 [Bacteroidales bacterium]|nr:hypothetical protein [Bacteroidales bacterium]